MISLGIVSISRTLQLVCSAPYLVTLLSFFLVPESVRWLRVKNKQEQLTKTLRRIAFWNRREYPDDLRLEPIAEKTVARKFSPADVFRGPGMALRSSILGYTWFVNGMNDMILWQECTYMYYRDFWPKKVLPLIFFVRMCPPPPIFENWKKQVYFCKEGST